MKTEAKTHCNILKKDGVVRIYNVLSPKVADSLREYVYDLRQNQKKRLKLVSHSPFKDLLLSCQEKTDVI